MTHHYDHDERRKQIVALLAYPKVGRLSVDAIAINLGTSEDEIRPALSSLLQDGCIVRADDGRLAAAPGIEHRKTKSVGPPANLKRTIAHGAPG